MERPNHRRVECKNNRAKAIWEDAKLKGADFRATGNEPGWHLEISRSFGIVFVTNYGSDRYTFAAPQPISDETSRTTKYEVNENGREKKKPTTPFKIKKDSKYCIFQYVIVNRT